MIIDKIRIRTSSIQTEIIIEAITKGGLYTTVQRGILTVSEYTNPRGIYLIRGVFKDWTRYYVEYKEAN